MIGIVEYQPRLDPSQQAGDLFIGDIQLIEGMNQVDIDKWNQFANHPLIQARISSGVIRPTFTAQTIIQVTEPKSRKVEKSVAEAVVTNQVTTVLNPITEALSVDTLSTIRPSELEKTIEKKK